MLDGPELFTDLLHLTVVGASLLLQATQRIDDFTALSGRALQRIPEGVDLLDDAAHRGLRCCGRGL